MLWIQACLVHPMVSQAVPVLTIHPGVAKPMVSDLFPPKPVQVRLLAMRSHRDVAGHPRRSMTPVILAGVLVVATATARPDPENFLLPLFLLTRLFNSSKKHSESKLLVCHKSE
jgi:hypothetical protein